MIWKTDWVPSDNYARNGIADFQRLLSNYEALRQLLIGLYNIDINFSNIVLDGWTTLPFTYSLNAVECNLRALHLLRHEWTDFSGVWEVGQPLPDYTDINRWERNGKSLDDALVRLQSVYLRCGAVVSGADFYFKN
ncbi:hypothetical protein FACS1894202_09760 [Clostridia bacterium]|nr:hypothetical protein FACS1894202_09760 [Clostridia bacterium]